MAEEEEEESHLHLDLPSGLFPSGLTTKILYALLLSPTRTTCLADIILLYLITRVIFGEKYRALSPSLCALLHYPVTLSLVGTNTFLRTLLAITLSYVPSRILRKQLQDIGEEEATLGSSLKELHAAKYLQFQFKLPIQQSPSTINTTVE